MSWVQSDLDAVEKAISSGVMEVQHSDGKRLKYRSINDLIKARDLIMAELSGKRGYRKRTIQVNVDSNLGSSPDEFGRGRRY